MTIDTADLRKRLLSGNYCEDDLFPLLDELEAAREHLAVVQSECTARENEVAMRAKNAALEEAAQAFQARWKEFNLLHCADAVRIVRALVAK